MAKNDKIRSFSCHKYFSHWLSLSIVNSFLYWTDIFQIFAWLNTCVYIFPQPARFSHWLNLRKPRERERIWRTKCVQHISLDVCFHPSCSCNRDVWEHFGHDELWPSVNNGPSPIHRVKLSQTKDCPHPPYEFPLCGSSCWNKPRSRSEHSNILDKI